MLTKGEAFKTPSRLGWLTKDELLFLKGLGSHGRTLRPRQKLLRGYIRAAGSRVEWDRVDRDIAIKTARDMLALTI